jgi:hypothetical protein
MNRLSINQLSMNWLLLIGALLGASSIMLGAFIQHGLSDLDARSLEQLMTALRYQQLHAVMISIIGISQWLPLHAAVQKRLSLCAYVWSIGCGLFCGIIFAAIFTHSPSLLKIAPSGGMTLIGGWLLLAYAARAIIVAHHQE